MLRGAFLDALLLLGDMGRLELSKHRDALEEKIESSTATDIEDIEQWQAFNCALHDEDRDVRLYNRVVGKDPHNTVLRLIALNSIFSRLNETQYNDQSLHYVKDFAEQLSKLRTSPKLREQLHAKGYSVVNFIKGSKACIAAAIAQNDQQLLQRMFDDMLNLAVSVNAMEIFEFEELANKNDVLAHDFKETFKQLGLRGQLQLTIAKCLFDEDPESLVLDKYYRPNPQLDEYLTEAGKLVPMLHAKISSAEFYDALCTVWGVMFGSVIRLVGENRNDSVYGTVHGLSRVVGVEQTEPTPEVGYQVPSRLRPCSDRIYRAIESLLVQLPDT